MVSPHPWGGCRGRSIRPGPTLEVKITRRWTNLEKLKKFYNLVPARADEINTPKVTRAIMEIRQLSNQSLDHQNIDKMPDLMNGFLLCLNNEPYQK